MKAAKEKGCGTAGDGFNWLAAERSSTKKRQPMTSVVGALCDNRQAAVMAADRLVSGSGLGVEIDVSKIIEISPQVIVGTSFGDRAGRDVTRWMTESLVGDRRPASKIADAVFAHFDSEVRRAREAVYKTRFNVDTAEFRQMLMQAPNSIPIQQAFNDAKDVSSSAQFIVAGFDASQMRLFAVLANEVAACDDRGSAAIGSGTGVAVVSLARRRFTPSLSLAETVLAVYEAKKASEMMMGVGQSTDLVVLRSGEPARWLSPEQIDELESMAEKRKPPALSPAEAEAINKMLA